MAITISGSTGITFPAGGVGNPAGAVVGTTDTQTLTNKTLTTPNVNSASVDTVSGTAPLYMARAWVNFNGTGTVAIRASGNVSSITDNGTGDYSINFSTAMPDANYAPIASVEETGIIVVTSANQSFQQTASAARIKVCLGISSTGYDADQVNVAIFR